MKSEEIRNRFLKFFESEPRNHKIIPSASLVTSDEKGVTNATLFNTAGMQPLIPYLLGEPHPLGTRLADVQKCLRTVDIDDVGDATHATFFEMLGNWSLGDYFKEDAIKWSYELLTNGDDKPEGDKGFGLDPKRLYITVFEGNENAPADEESEKIWQSVGIPKSRIYRMPADKNWWEAGDNGPCGPDTEMYYDVTEKGLGDLSREEFLAADDKREVVEIWNDVFLEYLKKDGKVVGKLPKKNVDTGAGLERLAMVLQGVNNIYDTDLFALIMEVLNKVSPDGNLRSKRIIADHIRSSVFIIFDGITPSNTDRGYVLRRLIRRAIRFGKELGLADDDYKEIINAVSQKYGNVYSNILQNIGMVESEFLGEVKKFSQTLEKGIKYAQNIGFFEMDKVDFSGRVTKHGDPKSEDLFKLYTTFGFPPEMAIEELENIIKEKQRILLENGLIHEQWWTLERKQELIDGFKILMKKHQDLSRAGAEQKFKGGLANANDEMVVRYHTATHLLHQALHDVLGENANQKGSNITAERLRFDFTHGAKMSSEEIKKVEEIVNEKIKADLPVNKVILPRAEAEKTGARHFFGEKYDDQISIYYIGDSLEGAYSKEFCGGPHVKNTKELAGPEGKWQFKITKEEAVAAGIRRIKAVLE